MIESIETVADVPQPNSGERRRSGRIAKSSRILSQSPEPSSKSSSRTPSIKTCGHDQTKQANNSNSTKNSPASSSMKEPPASQAEQTKTDASEATSLSSLMKEPPNGKTKQAETTSTASLSKETHEGEKEQATTDNSSNTITTPSSVKEAPLNSREQMKTSHSTPPSPLGKRKRPEPAVQMPSEDSSCVEYLMTPLSEKERVAWKGWAEIESEPALFNYILKQHGVKEIKVTELTGVTDEVLNELPNPVHGLIFLYNYRDDGGDEEDLPKAPKHLWFANQVATNSCATVAMLNILMNVSGIELGDTLKALKESTRLKKPPFRGKALANNAAIRITHNSFVRRVDVLNSDLILEQDFKRWEKARKSKKRKVVTSKKSTSTKREKKADEEPAFHFIAYVPLNGEVWRLDGLQSQPINLGRTATGSWLNLARDNIVAHMSRYPDSQSYNFMALCTSPLVTLQHDLAANTHSLFSLESTLSSLDPDWRLFMTSDTASPPRELDESFGISKEVIDAAVPKEKDRKKVEEVGQDFEGLMRVYAELVSEQKRLQVMYIEEVNNGMEEDEKAEKAKRDFSPFIYRIIKEMAEDGTLRQIWWEYEDED